MIVEKLQFKSIVHSRVAIHPDPIGVINFFGDDLNSIFPTTQYHKLLKSLFALGYTIIVKPGRLNWNHWSVAIALIKEYSQHNLLGKIKAEAEKLGYESHLYQTSNNYSAANYFWLGYGLGCKYIILLEIINNLQNKKYQIFLQEYLGKKQYSQIEQLLKLVDLESISRICHPSIFINPVLTECTNLQGLDIFAQVIESYHLVKPNKEQTSNLIRFSYKFSPLVLIGLNPNFAEAETINWLQQEISQEFSTLKRSQLLGAHFVSLECSQHQNDLALAVMSILSKNKR